MVLIMIEKKKETAVFEVESIPFHYTTVVSTFIRSLTACTTKHTNASEEVIHFSRMRSTWEEVLVSI